MTSPATEVKVPKGSKLIASRKSRQTGTPITIIDNGKTAEHRWLLRCETHSTEQHPASHAEACRVARTPTEWCPACKRTAAKAGK